MPMRSHVDPCTFVTFIHVPREQMGAEQVALLRDFVPKQGAPSSELLAHLPERGHQVHFHEDYHYWQGLRLPFLFRYATLSFRTAWVAFKQMADAESDHRHWGCLLPELERLGLDERVAYSDDGHIFWGRSEAQFPPNLREEISLRPLDLLECATSLAEFQVSAVGDKSDPAVLKRWAKRNPAYLAPLEFAARFLGNNPGLALRTMLPLINAAFHTNEPVRAWVELLARVWGNFVPASDFATAFLAQREPCRWPELFAKFLADLPYEAKPNADGKLLGSPFHRIGLDEWVGGAITDGKGGTLVHPFLGLQARKWIQDQLRMPEYGLLMDQPGWVRHETFWQCRREFSPPLTVFRFHLGGGDDRVIFTGTKDGRAFTSLALNSESEWRAVVIDFLTMYGAVRRASGAHFDAEQRTCHHSACPHYTENFCNMYPVVPKNHRTCGFPDRIKGLIHTFRRL